MTRLIDADALVKDFEKVYEFYMNEIKEANENPDNYTSKFLPATAGAIDGLVEAEIVIADAPTIEPFTDNISRSQAIKGVSEWATDILHPDRLVKEDAIYILESLPSAEQITGKLNNPDDSLLTADSEACKEQKSKLDLISRQDAIAYFFRPYSNEELYSNTDIEKALNALPSAKGGDAEMNEVKSPFMQQSPDDGADLISRQAVIELIKNSYYNLAENMDDVWAMVHDVEQLPSAPDSRQRGEWVGCTGCEHYDQQQTSLICHDCRRYYSDKYKGGEEE